MRWEALTLLLACGSAPPTDAPLLLELKNDGPAGVRGLSVDGVSYVQGVLQPGKDVGAYWWAIGPPVGAEPFKVGEVRAAPPVRALIGSALGFSVFASSVVDGGCTSQHDVPPEGLRLRAVYRSDSDGGPQRSHDSCDFIFSAPDAGL